MSPRIQIRRSTYRGCPGFTISGVNGRGQYISIFAESRQAAEHIRDKVKRGEWIELEDFYVKGKEQ